MRIGVVFIGLLAIGGCDPGPMPTPPTPRTPIGWGPGAIDLAHRQLDWFPSDSHDPFPLDIALRTNRLDEVRRLLASGANPNLRWGHSGDHFPLVPQPPFGVEREDRQLGRVRTLIRIGADPNERAARGGADWTPIAMALHQRALRAARLLLENGADPNQRTCVDLIHGSFSAKWSHGPAFSRDPACTPDNGMTALISRVRADDLAAVKLLLEFHADRSLRDWMGRTALDYAKDPEIRKLLESPAAQ